MSALRRRLSRMKGDAGITLAELIVTMAISSLVLSLVATMFVSVSRSTRDSVDRSQSVAEVQNMFDVISTDIRAGTNITTNSPVTWAITNAGTNSITLITYTDAGPSFATGPFQVTFYVDGAGRLVEGRWPIPASTTAYPIAGAPASAPIKRILGNQVQSLSFTYVYPTCPTLPTPCSYGLGDIDAVNISITVKAAGSRVPVTVSSTVYMPNAGSKQNYAGS